MLIKTLVRKQGEFFILKKIKIKMGHYIDY